MHVEQEITGDERSALRTIVEADQEREWLLKVEEMLVAGDEETEKALGIGLNEIYERLEDIDAGSRYARERLGEPGQGPERDAEQADHLDGRAAAREGAAPATEISWRQS